MVRQAMQLPYLFLDMITLSIRGDRLCSTIGFASPKNFRDYVPAVHCTALTKDDKDVIDYECNSF